LFERELKDSSRISRLVVGQSAELERRYHAQIKPKAINLFMFHRQGRYLIEPRPEGFALKGTRQHFTNEELLSILASDPSVFSPNVVLRPLCQDTLLPTVAYVAGPAEISYFAQLRPLYPEYGIPQPLLYPRASATIVEEKVQRVLERFRLDVSSFFKDTELLKQSVAGTLSTVNLDELFGGTNISLDETWTSLSKGLQQIDQTLGGTVNTAREKTLAHLSALKQKAAAAQARNHEVVLRQIDKAALHLHPGSHYQERELNVLHFLNKYGLEFLRWLRSELVIDKFKHQIIPL
jgi:bacillithiol biosynthesis cysteine-adding enzyme BshC